VLTEYEVGGLRDIAILGENGMRDKTSLFVRQD
jgi:hypothetical protein